MAKKETTDSLKVEGAVNIISDANYGVHYLVIYPDLLTLREFYSYYVHKNVE